MFLQGIQFLLATAIALGFTLSVQAETIYVKLLVDEEEPAVERVWKQRLRRCLQLTSSVIQRYGGVKFTLAGFGTWQSDNRIDELSRSLREFEREASPDPGQIAIGFSSQYRFTRGRHHLAGTRGPLHSHTLVRESGPRITEPERVEVLVHELGHFLGAVHSERPDSVMRPVLGDGKSRLRSFRIVFDPENARVIRLVAAEISNLDVRRFEDLTSETKQEIREIYESLAKKLPDDPAAPRFLRLVE